MKPKVLGVFVLGLLLAGAVPAQAGLIGSDVDVTFYFPDMATVFCSNGTATVGAGVEYPSSCSGFDPVSIDIGDNQIQVDTGGIGWSTGAFNGFLLSILSGPAITSATYGGGTMGVTDLEVDGGNLWVNFAGQSGGIALIDFETEQVPEPGTLGFLAVGLAGAALRRRRTADGSLDGRR
jgi:hypothetical protein